MNIGFGERLQKALKANGLTVAELSRRTGISSNTLYSAIRRKSNKIDPEVIKKICDNTDITVYDLIEDLDLVTLSYWGAETSETQKDLADYVMRTIDNDITLNEIEEIYNNLNDLGKKIAYERIAELAEIPKYKKKKYKAADTSAPSDQDE